ncbi:MAG: hypothetical protein ACAF41_06515 [Leptolyngbya sp. BL-A-14]
MVKVTFLNDDNDRRVMPLTIDFGLPLMPDAIALNLGESCNAPMSQ